MTVAELLVEGHSFYQFVLEQARRWPDIPGIHDLVRESREFLAGLLELRRLGQPAPAGMSAPFVI